MRMWMVNPNYMCNQHLLGEHNEIHKHRHIFMRGYCLAGRRGQIEPKSMKIRHDELVSEMLIRGMNHKSPYEMPDLTEEAKDMVVDRVLSLALLRNRCEKCRTRINSNQKS